MFLVSFIMNVTAMSWETKWGRETAKKQFSFSLSLNTKNQTSCQTWVNKLWKSFNKEAKYILWKRKKVVQQNHEVSNNNSVFTLMTEIQSGYVKGKIKRELEYSEHEVHDYYWQVPEVLNVKNEGWRKSSRRTK